MTLAIPYIVLPLLLYMYSILATYFLFILSIWTSRKKSFDGINNYLHFSLYVDDAGDNTGLYLFAETHPSNLSTTILRISVLTFRLPRDSHQPRVIYARGVLK